MESVILFDNENYWKLDLKKWDSGEEYKYKGNGTSMSTR
jgi:hypothetical protein